MLCPRRLRVEEPELFGCEIYERCTLVTFETLLRGVGSCARVEVFLVNIVVIRAGLGLVKCRRSH